MINVFEPDLGDLELQALGKTIRTKWIGKGPKEELFRTEFGKIVGISPNSLISYNSCTEAFFQLFDFLDLPIDSEVVLPSISFVGVANAIAAAGVKLRFCDVSTLNGNPTLNDIKKLITNKTRAIVFPHYGGNMGEIDKIAEYCSNHELLLIEDAAAAVGSSIDGISAGTFGDYGLWSFDAMKSISCGDGGILYCKNAAQVNDLRIQGYLGLNFTSGLSRSSSTNDRWWNFEVNSLGRRSIMNDLSASIGVAQIARFKEKSLKRQEIYGEYQKQLKDIKDIKILIENSRSRSHSLYFLPIWVSKSRDQLASHLRAHDIYTTFRYLPLHHQEIYKCTNLLPHSDEFSEHVLLLPMHTNLTTSQVAEICVVIKSYYD